MLSVFWYHIIFKSSSKDGAQPPRSKQAISTYDLSVCPQKTRLEETYIDSNRLLQIKRKQNKLIKSLSKRHTPNQCPITKSGIRDG